MIICRVEATVVATIKHPVYQGCKVLMVQPIDARGEPVGESFLSVDFVQAGVGDRVLVVKEGSSARLVFGKEIAPVHSVIVGVIDEIDTGEAE